MLPEAVLTALFIFGLRTMNNTMTTIRLVVLTRDRRGLAFALGFVESIIFAVTIGAVVANLSDIVNLLAYASGFSIGGYIGQWIEAHFIKGFVTVNIIVADGGHDLAAMLRKQGYGVTETLGEGTGGTVVVLRSVLIRQQVSEMLGKVREINDNAFVTVEETRAVHRGWIKAARNQL